MSGRSRRPNYPLVVTTAVAIHRDVPVPAKLYLAAAAALPGRDPGVRRLARLFPYDDGTLTRAALALERHGLARLVRRPGRRLTVEPIGLGAPGKQGRNRYAVLPAPLVQAGLDATTPRRAGVGLLLLSRLLRDQRRRSACQAPAAVLAADLGVKPLLVLKLLDDFEHAGIIERHRRHPLDSDELPLYSVPLADPLYPIDLARLDPDQTRLREHLQAGEHDLTVLAPRSDLTRLAVRLAELRAAGLDAAANTALGDLAATNLTGAVVLAADVLTTLNGTLGAPSRDTHPQVHGTPGDDSRDTSKDSDLDPEKRYAEDDDQGAGFAHAQATARRSGKTVW